ncbi:helix-turn-helix domain-containing protein [Muricauda sp. SCSIO 64092]|uniref:AraC family transcriptional regulator n=1 Tax=Allomuricauda sp. SCSIO 64092 TaxID=2908842 RepID=UPI001FF224B9|nr:AraC family transcriptional regulator [Muricauda sp. SCSIO 64092]UOY06504.1 helix-turn-helix domain-containing protein [Muricauda sp. SCSIO 64092]
MKIYHNIRDLLLDWGIHSKPNNGNIHIFRIEDYFEDKPLAFGPYQQDFFELTFGIGHDADITIGASRFNSIQASISFTPPYQITSWTLYRFHKDSLGYMILFRPQLLGATLDKIDFYKTYPFLNLHTAPMLFLDDEQQTTIVDLMHTLLLEYNNAEQKGHETILASYLTIILEKIKGLFQTPANLGFASRIQEIAFRFEVLLKDQARYDQKIPHFAEQLHISTPYLSEAVKKVTGKTAISILQEYVILKAKSLLKQTDSPIGTIAESLGFTEATNFNKYFKKNTGITPGTYRKLP